MPPPSSSLSLSLYVPYPTKSKKRILLQYYRRNNNQNIFTIIQGYSPSQTKYFALTLRTKSSFDSSRCVLQRNNFVPDQFLVASLFIRPPFGVNKIDWMRRWFRKEKKMIVARRASNKRSLWEMSNQLHHELMIRTNRTSTRFPEPKIHCCAFEKAGLFELWRARGIWIKACVLSARDSRRGDWVTLQS